MPTKPRKNFALDLGTPVMEYFSESKIQAWLFFASSSPLKGIVSRQKKEETALQSNNTQVSDKKVIKILPNAQNLHAERNA